MNAKVRNLMEQASRGSAAAQRQLAECFYYGRGTKRSVAEAVAWLMLAAVNGDADAKHLVCSLCNRGMLRVTVPHKARS
jgi:TPR repeat protein